MTSKWKKGLSLEEINMRFGEEGDHSVLEMIPRQGIVNQTSLKRSKVSNTEDALYGQVMPANYAKSGHSFSNDVDISEQRN